VSSVGLEQIVLAYLALDPSAIQDPEAVAA
jgi:hypothetical protein